MIDAGTVSSTALGRLRIAVICGGPGPEHAVSISGGRAIASALRRRGHAVAVCRVSVRGTWTTDGRGGLRAALDALRSADVAVPALHGRWGEDGGVQGFLETIGVGYTGSGVLASATCMDKGRTKALLAAAGVAVAPGRIVGAPLLQPEAAAVVDALGLPLFVKPLRGGSSFGVSRVASAAELAPAVSLAGRYDSWVLVEPEVRGREIDVGVLELANGSYQVSPALEICSDPAEPFFTTAAKYASDRTRFLVPAPIDAALAGEMAVLACRAFSVLGCAGLGRVDFLVNAAGEPVVNEVNTFPGFTERSQFPLMWRTAGIGFAELVEAMIATALAGSRAARSA